MTDRRESTRPSRWFAKARSDLEKYLKGYLLSRGWELKRVHDLEFLLDEALAFDTQLEGFRDLCQEVTGYYLTERYPFLPEGPSREEIDANLERAKELVQYLEGSET